MNLQTRTKYFDYLRIFACLAVVMLHTSGAWFLHAELGTGSWWIALVLDVSTRWAVPIFIMISGALFLEKNIENSKLYGKYILRLVTAFVFWSFIYAIITDPHANIKGLIVNVLYGHYHMWFLYMLIGLYMTVPILRKVVVDIKLTKYFLVLAFVFGAFLPHMLDVFQVIPALRQVGEIFSIILDKLQIHMFVGSIGYFVAGYYLNNITISQKARKCLYILGAGGFAVSVLLTKWACSVRQEPSELFMSGLAFPVMLFTIAIFVWAKYELGKAELSDSVNRIVVYMSKCSFGVYLVHALILNIVMRTIRFNTTPIATLVLIICISTGVFLSSMIISVVLHQIPLLKKYIV